MNHKFELNAEVYTDNVSGDMQSSETELAYKFNFKSGYNGMVAGKNSFENVDKDFTLSDEADVPAGKYSFYYFETHLHSPQSNTLIIISGDCWNSSFPDRVNDFIGPDIITYQITQTINGIRLLLINTNQTCFECR